MKTRVFAGFFFFFDIVKQMQQGKRPYKIKVDVRISVVKPLYAKWNVKFYHYIQSKPEIIQNGSLVSVENLLKGINLDPFV